MKALVMKGPNDYKVEDVPKPECPKDGVLIKVIGCGLCGSDLRILKHGKNTIDYPHTTGHEVSGEIVEIGEDYEGKWDIGDKLAVAPLVYCGECEFCLKGEFEFCKNYKEIGQHWSGGFAEYMVIPKESLDLGAIQEIPEGLDPVVASVSEPISACFNGQEKGNIGYGDTVVIIGAGPIGCIHASLAKARGADKVITADINNERLEKTKNFGADILINASEKDLVKEVMKITNELGAEVVITANPVPQTQVQAVEMAKKGGRILLFGGLPPKKSKPGIDTNIVHYRALSLIGTSIFSPVHQYEAIKLLKNGRIPGEKLVTHRLPLTEFKKGVKLAEEGKALKVVFTPNQ